MAMQNTPRKFKAFPNCSPECTKEPRREISDSIPYEISRKQMRGRSASFPHNAMCKKTLERKSILLYDTIHEQRRNRTHTLPPSPFQNHKFETEKMIYQPRRHSLPSSISCTKIKNDLTKKLTKARSQSFEREAACLDAAASNDIDTLSRLLLNRKVDISYCNSRGFTMLHHAAASGSVDCLTFLLKTGADLNQGKISPLELAVKGGFFECAKILIHSGAEVGGLINGVQNLQFG